MSNYESSLARVTAYKELNLDYYRLIQQTDAAGSPELISLISNLFAANTLEERWQLLKRCFANFGADQINYGLFESFAADRKQASVGFLSTMTTDWLNYYTSEQIDLRDPHLALVRERTVPNYLFGESSLSICERGKDYDLLVDIFDAGLKAGIHLVLNDPWDSKQPAGMMTIGSSLSERDYYRCVLPNYASINAAAQVFHMLAVGDMRSRQSAYAKLTRRERECLKYIADGLRIDSVAEKLNVKRVTVDLHLRNARRKLGASTLPEAVAKALVLNELHFS